MLSVRISQCFDSSMADIIQLLPDSIANQIAAGEVVQRPASAVKELMENAVDAGAQNIKLILKDSGKTLIQVIDDGCGMSETDARMSFERHATSKIREAKDLFTIRTMGFRGEALASIASISQVELKTRRAIEDLGTRIVIEGFDLKLQESCQTPVGTSISVKNLFYNIPARRNFLKSNTVEMRHVLDEFERIALSNPDIFFSLHHNGTEIFHLPIGNLRQRIVNVFGKESNKHLVPVDEDTDVLKLTGFVGKPEMAKKTRGEQFFFVNNRFIKSAYLHHAVQTAFEDIISKESYPFYVIFMEIDPARIDINVHPTKQEIKFEDERLIYNYLKVSVRHALGRNSITPSLDFEQQNIFSRQYVVPRDIRKDSPSQDGEETVSQQPNWKPKMDPNKGSGSDYRVPPSAKNWESLYAGLDNLSFDSDTIANPSDTARADLFTIDSEWADAKEMDYLEQPVSQTKEPYQIHHSYIVSQIKSGFLLVDQQAAHERILYEKYLDLLGEKQVYTQRELFPKTLHFSASQVEVLREILPEINRLGFDIQEFGGQSFVVHGIPADWMVGQDEQKVIEGLLDQYGREMDLKLDLKERVARSMARSGAVKKGTAMTETEMRHLIDHLFGCTMPFKSPTGRNCFITFELSGLEKEFMKG